MRKVVFYFQSQTHFWLFISYFLASEKQALSIPSNSLLCFPWQKLAFCGPWRGSETQSGSLISYGRTGQNAYLACSSRVMVH